MAGRRDTLRGLSSFKSRGHRLIALVPPENANSDIDSSSESDNEEDIALNSTEELSSSPCPSIDSDIERMNILNNSENDTQDNTSVDSDETYIDVYTLMEAGNKNLQRSNLSGSEHNSALDVEENLNHEQTPLTPVINNVLPPTGEVNYSALPSLASLLSIPSSNASPSNASPSTLTSRTTRRKRKQQVRAEPNVQAKKTKKILVVNYKWKKGQFQHKADIPSNDFLFDLTDTDSPLDFFYLFFSPDILNDIVNNTNLYSTQRTGKCIQLTVEELKDFLTILLIMGIVRMPSYDDYNIGAQISDMIKWPT